MTSSPGNPPPSRARSGLHSSPGGGPPSVRIRRALRSRPLGELPTREQAVLACLSAVGLMLCVGLAVWCVAALAGLFAGVELRDLWVLLNDPLGSPLVRSPGWIAFGVVANEAALGFVLVYWVRRLKLNWRTVLPLERPPLVCLVGALCLIFGLAPFAELASLAASSFTGEEAPAARAITSAARDASRPEFALLVSVVALAPALAEEAMFRGFVTAPFLRQSRFQAVVLPSVLFALFHLDVAQAAGTFILGLGFALVRLLTGSLIASMLAHAVYNGAVVVAVRFTAQGEEGAVRLSALAVGAGLMVLGLVLLTRKAAPRVGSG